MRLRKDIYMLALLAAMSANAQNLSTEITVERVVEPSMREAYRPVWAPTLLQTPVQAVNLHAAEFMQPGTIVNSHYTMPAAMWADTIAATPYRGYASAGYFPGFNLGANAGYRFIENQKASLGAWMQYDGNKYSRAYNPPLPADNGAKYYTQDMTMANHFANVGVDGVFQLAPASSLSMALNYQYSNVARPSILKKEGNKQASNQASLQLKWDARAGQIKYDIAAHAQYFAFGKEAVKILNTGMDDPLKQTGAGLSAHAGYCRSGESEPWLGVKVDGQMLHSNDTVGTIGEFHFRPYAAFAGNGFRATIGINLSSGAKLHIAPDVRLSWAPDKLPVSAFVNFGGSEELTPVSQLFALDPYVATHRTLGRSLVKYDVSAGLNVGPFDGFCLKFSGGYADANTYAPVFTVDPTFLPLWYSAYGGTCYGLIDHKSWHAGIAASYDYKGIVAVEAGYQTAGSNEDGLSWYGWLDQAKHVLSASVKARPIARLDVSVDYSLRTGRHGFTRHGPLFGQNLDLGSISDLSVTASYEVTPAITVFARGENLLNQEYYLISAVPAQGIKGLAGVAIKF